jgi:enoyl-CoA hydratase/carnithine racemase
VSDVREEQEGPVRILTLDRPETFNALTLDSMRELGDRLEAAAASAEVRAVVLTGKGNAFSAGGDSRFLLDLPSLPDQAIRDVVYGTFQRPIRVMRAMDKVVIAAVNGAAVGAGCELTLAADVRIASDRARFGEVWIKIGCVPALGGMYLLPRIVGLGRATDMILTGEIIDAAEALRIGLVTSVVPADGLLEIAVAHARLLATGPTRALAAAKAAINRGLASTVWNELDATVSDQLACFRTRDFAEGVRALAEHRPPHFTGD